MTKLNYDRPFPYGRSYGYSLESGHGKTNRGYKAPMKKITEILSCNACGSEELIFKAGTGPHALSVRCVDCGAFRWLSKSDSERALAKIENRSQETQGGVRPENR